ncbi:MAG: leucyl aminopeptidase family protein, partial [Planctomycetia bacterium]
MSLTLENAPAESAVADVLVVFVHQDDDAALPEGRLGASLKPRLASLRAGQDFEGKPYELVALYGVGGVTAGRVLFVGLGKRAAYTPLVLSRAASAAARWTAGKPRGRLLFTLPYLAVGGAPEPEIAAKTAAIVSGALVGAVGQDLYRAEKTRTAPVEISVAAGAGEAAGVDAGLKRGRILGESINLARRLVNLPPAELYPESFCNTAAALAAEYGVGVEIHGPEALAKLGMNCILAVGGASSRPPRLLTLRYEPELPADAPTLTFVGKGITFDSGGVCIKTADGMLDMKCDMAGAATVLAATLAVARLKLPVRLLTLAPLAENMLGGDAFRPGDVLTAKNGKTIEIVNTDAEGRLVLADALSHAVDLGATHVVDLATLTGACCVALGMHTAGVMTNDDAW